MSFLKSKWVKVTLITVVCLAATPCLLAAAYIGFLIYYEADRKFAYRIPVEDGKTLQVSGNYSHFLDQGDEERCQKTTRWELQGRGDKGGALELLEDRVDRAAADDCDTSTAQPKVTEWRESKGRGWLRVDDVLYHQPRHLGNFWSIGRFNSNYRIERFYPDRNTLILQLKRGLTPNSKLLPRMVMRANEMGVWRRDELASRQVSEPVLFPFGRVKVQFVWARLPKNWRTSLGGWNGQGDLRSRLLKMKAPILKAETKLFSRRVESNFKWDKWNTARALIKWNDAHQISVHDVYGESRRAQIGPWNFPVGAINGGGIQAFIRVEQAEK